MYISDEALLALALRGSSGSGGGGGGTSGNLMVVNMTYDSSNGYFVGDKTYGEVHDAVASGTPAVLIHPLKGSDDGYVVNWVMRSVRGRITTIWYLNGNPDDADVVGTLIPHAGGADSEYIRIYYGTPKD